MLNKKEWFRYLGETKSLAVVKIVMAALTIACVIANIAIDYEYNKIVLTMTAFAALACLAAVIIYVRNNWYAVVIAGVIALCVYSAWADCFWCLFFPAEETLSLTYVAMVSMTITCIFCFSILLFLKGELRKNTEEDSLLSQECYNPLIVAGLFALLVFIFFYGYIEPTVPGERGDIKPIYEYSLILFIFAFMYSGKKWYTVVPLTLLVLAFAAKDLIYGGRRTALSLMLLLFFVFLAHRLSFIKVLPIAAVGYIVLSVVGRFRGGVDFSFDQIRETLDVLFDKRLTIDTMYSAYYTGMTFVACTTEQIFTMGDRLRMFGSFLISMITGGGRVENSALPMVTREYFLHWYGGVFPFYGYFYLWHFGTVLTGAVSAMWMNLAGKWQNIKPLAKVLLMWNVSTVFAWVLYTPSSMIRGSLFVAVGWLACKWGDKISKILFDMIKNKIGSKKANVSDN